MKKPKLNVGDDVGIIETESRGKEKRKRHKLKLSKVESKNGKKVKVKDDPDEFEETGEHLTKTEKRLLKLPDRIMKRILKSPLAGKNNKIKKILIDESLLNSFDLDNEADA